MWPREIDFPQTRIPVLGTIVLALSFAACSPVRKVADMMGGALASGGSVYASNDDPALVREAIPFGLKTLESLHKASPNNRNILLACEARPRKRYHDNLSSSQLRARLIGCYAIVAATAASLRRI